MKKTKMKILDDIAKKLSKKQRSDLEMSFKWSISCLNYLNLNINKQFLKTELGEDYYLIENIF